MIIISSLLFSNFFIVLAVSCCWVWLEPKKLYSTDTFLDALVWTRLNETSLGSLAWSDLQEARYVGVLPVNRTILDRTQAPSILCYCIFIDRSLLVGWGQFLQKTFKNKQHSRYIFWLLSITSFNLKKKVTFEVKINKSSAIMLYISISVIPKILKLSLASTNNLPMSWEAYFQIFK